LEHAPGPLQLGFPCEHGGKTLRLVAVEVVVAALLAADLTGTVLVGAKLTRTKVTGVRWVESDPPVWPAGFDPPPTAEHPDPRRHPTISSVLRAGVIPQKSRGRAGNVRNHR
jgi:hypothetical protein